MTDFEKIEQFFKEDNIIDLLNKEPGHLEKLEKRVVEDNNTNDFLRIEGTCEFGFDTFDTITVDDIEKTLFEHLLSYYDILPPFILKTLGIEYPNLDFEDDEVTENHLIISFLKNSMHVQFYKGDNSLVASINAKIRYDFK